MRSLSSPYIPRRDSSFSSTADSSVLFTRVALPSLSSTAPATPPRLPLPPVYDPDALTSTTFEAHNLSTEAVLSLAPPLSDRTALTTLDMANNDMWDRGVRAVADAIRCCPSLRSVNLGNNRIAGTGACLTVLSGVVVTHRCSSRDRSNSS